ncbi:unnamed protein product [Arabidopsis thaliana]|uniref:Prolamin-like domain-containing protein n=1 Tax=Arabidopsis thaliana TaxID=3702 RepID=A0A5S9XM36_ARATH|nr:unnamed protein product [Arabidopsis thaliana]VYS60603.1 unnamed protein product [Arabidopsis thaliana]
MALKATMVTKSMFAALFTIIAMATLASAASGLAQSPESDHLVNKCMAKLSSRCAMYVTDAICTIHGPMRLKHHGCCLEVFHMGRACLKIVTNHIQVAIIKNTDVNIVMEIEELNALSRGYYCNQINSSVFSRSPSINQVLFLTFQFGIALLVSRKLV